MKINKSSDWPAAAHLPKSTLANDLFTSFVMKSTAELVPPPPPKSPLSDTSDLKGAALEQLSALKEVEVPDLSTRPIGKAGRFSCSVNLLKSIIGSGMLSLPFAISLTGLIPGISLLFLAAAMALMGLYLLVLCSWRVGGRGVNFSILAKHTYPRTAPIFDLAIGIKCIGVATSYLTVVGTLMAQVMQGILLSGEEQERMNLAQKIFTHRVFWTSTALLLIGPVCFMPKMDSLKYTSFLGLGSVVYLLGLSITLFFQQWARQGNPFASVQWVAPFSVGAMRSFSVFVFAFTCHQNIFPIHNEAKHNRPSSFSRIMSLCVGISLAIYLTFSITAYATFADPGPAANIISSYPKKGAAFMIARFLYVFLVLFSYPLQTFPGRTSFTSFMAYWCPTCTQRYPRIIYNGLTIALLLFTWAIASIDPPLELVLGLIGSTAGPILCYFLPATFWLCLERGKKWDWRSISAVILNVFGTITTVISLTALIWSQVAKSKS